MNKLSQFWQELKRRKVVRVITVYAATAFVILELTDIVAPSLGLPDWTLNLIIILLIAGLIIAAILSWIYDINPQGEMVKTEPSQKVKEEELLTKSNGWKIVSFASFAIIIAFILFHLFYRNNNSIDLAIIDKSVAVIPFIDDSPDKSNEHIINGIMEDLVINLQSIKELRVLGRTSVEQYRNNPKTIPEITQEMNVAYIVVGSGQRYGNKIRLRIQLVEGATDKQLWADSYDEEINGPEDIFRIQSQIAKAIALELQTVITPEEKQILEKVPTTNLTAHDFYLKGKEEYLKYRIDISDRKALIRAENLYFKALQYDSTFARVYTGLALIEYSKHSPDVRYSGFLSDTYFEEEFLDSILTLADIALSYDFQLAEAYTIKGIYYLSKGLADQAIKEFDKAIKFNPNDWIAYYEKGNLYRYTDPIRTIDNYQKAAALNHGSELPGILIDIGWAYYSAGYFEKNEYYIKEALNLNDDSASYYYSLASTEFWLGNFEKGIDFGEKAYAQGSARNPNLNILAESYARLGQYEESLRYYKIWVEELDSLDILAVNNMHRIAYVYWQNGFEEKANYYFNEQIDYCQRSIEMGRLYEKLSWVNYDLAAVYAFKGEKDKALEYLRLFNKEQKMIFWWITLFEFDPLLDNIRNEPEFQQILKDVEAKYQAEHERVRQWLEENDMS